jgi:hypothetical protein
MILEHDVSTSQITVLTALYLWNFGRALSFVLASEANFCTSESDFKCEKNMWIIKVYFGSLRDWKNASK